MSADVLAELLEARRARRPCVLVTVAATKGSVPREPGSKMLCYADGRTSGSVGGGKLEALVIEQCPQILRSALPALKTFPLHEGTPDSFGAICGGEVTVLFEPQVPGERLILVGAGHCGQAIARLALECGFAVEVIDDRQEFRDTQFFPGAVRFVADAGAGFFAAETLGPRDCVVLVSRNHGLDRDALRAVLPQIDRAGYVGMIGSARKVRKVFAELAAAGADPAQLGRVYAPIGLDLGADSPAEIAVSVLAEILKVRRGRSGAHMKLAAMSGTE